MRRSGGGRIDLILGVFIALIAGSCAGPQSTAITLEDDDAMATEMAYALQRDVFADRGPDSPPMRIAINKVQNLTTDVIPVDRQWHIIARIRDAQPIVELSRERNVQFVIPAEYLQETLGGDDSIRGQGFGAGRDPTHTMSATFRSIRRTHEEHRTDVYLCSFEMTELDTGAIVWQGDFEFKRAAVGRSYD